MKSLQICWYCGKWYDNDSGTWYPKWTLTTKTAVSIQLAPRGPRGVSDGVVPPEGVEFVCCPMHPKGYDNTMFLG